jgi:biotin carboxyl carrier protein
METRELRGVLEWMKTTDLVEVGYKKDGRGFSLSSETPIPAGDFPSSRFVPATASAVGIFQWGAPGRPKAAEEGSSVKEGDLLAVVIGAGEPSPVKAPCSGTVAKVFVEPGDAVDFGRPLFLIRAES